MFIFWSNKKQIINEAKCIEKYGVLQWIYRLSIFGWDTADNIPGVKGEKNSRNTYKEFKNIERHEKYWKNK